MRAPHTAKCETNLKSELKLSYFFFREKGARFEHTESLLIPGKITYLGTAMIWIRQNKAQNK